LASAGSAAAAALGLWCGTAQADYPVVSATIYPGSSGSVSTRQVPLSALGNCPPYSGSSTMYMSPSGIDETVPSSSWAMSTVVTCGLQIPLGNVSQVQVDNPSRGFEAPLSSADLSTPSPYQDPSAQPLVSTNGSQDQNTYTRPWLGGSDQNGPDQVVQDNAPVTIVVYQNGSVLTVHAQGHIVSATANAMTVDFSATVQNAQGTEIPPSALSWSWSFGDSSTAGTAAPAHTYASAGAYYVTVQVTDAQDGSGGTDTFQVSSPSPAAPGPHNHNGAGNHPKAKSPGGPTHTSGTHTGAPSGRSRQSGSSRSSSDTTTAPAQTPQTTSTTAPAPTQTAAPPAPHPSPPQPPRRRAAPARRNRHPAHRTAPASGRGRLITGRLVSDVVPLSADASPLVHSVPAAAASAAPVRRATQTSSLTGVVAAVVIALLLALGGARELRGSRAWHNRAT
jgi:hypothetical protein